MGARGQLCELLLNVIRESATTGQFVVLDLSDWEYCDTGQAAFMMPLKEAHAHGVAFGAVLPRNRALREYRWRGADERLRCYLTFEAALAALRRLTRDSVWCAGAVIEDLYEVIDVIGEGGMGTVYRVRHKRWKVDLAVKSPKPELVMDAVGRENFIRECETWVTLGSHPHIVCCYYIRALGITPASHGNARTPRIFIEFVDGGSLRDWILARRLYEGDESDVLERILDIAIQFAWGLQYAHDKGLIHRDVKPANVMITTEGTAKLTDFGVSRALAVAGATGDSDQTVLMTSGGMTPAYCSPEQVSAQVLTNKTDVWSWAVSVLEMFTGGVTWVAGPAAAEALRHYTPQRGDDRALPPMPRRVAELLRRCLAHSPEYRPSMREIASELCDIYAGVRQRAYGRRQRASAVIDADGFNNRALSLVDLSKGAEAELAWQAALDADASHPDSTYNFGLIRWRRGDIPDDVLAAQLSAAASRHDDYRATYLQALFELERGDENAAAALLARASGRAPHAPEVHEAIALSKSHEFVGGKCIRVFDVQDDFFGAGSLCLSPDGRSALTDGVVGNRLALWDVESGVIVRRFKGHDRPVRCLASSDDMRWAVSACADATMRIWDVAAGICVQSLDLDGDAISVALSWNGRFALSNVRSGNGTRLAIWEANTGECLHTRDCEERVTCAYLSFTQDADKALSWYVVAGCEEGTLCEWSRYPRSSHWRRDGKHEAGGITALCPAEGKPLTAGEDHSVRLWGVIWKNADAVWKDGAWPGGYKERVFTGHTDVVRCVAFNEQVRRALSGSADGTLRLWDTTTGRCLRTFETNGIVDGVAFTADGRRALSAGARGMQLWQLPQGLPGALQLSRPIGEVTRRSR